jgi:diadenosine tetraphosphatase ApaH/serine/threonine PP2A family protein phosphatase
MIYAIISDIHGNLEALNSALKEIDRIRADKVLCLGDIVGYGANPNECIDTLKQRGIESISGNHDAVACGKKEPIGFNPVAKKAILWTRNALTQENKEFLWNLPDTRQYGEFIAVHGSISDPDLYILSTYDALMEFKLMQDQSICFFGHTHVRISYVFCNGEVQSLFHNEFRIKPDKKYLINPGSIGQPRDRDPRASFLIYDTVEKSIRFIRVNYDIPKAQAKIVKAGLDKWLADRLLLGV